MGGIGNGNEQECCRSGSFVLENIVSPSGDTVRPRCAINACEV